MAAAQAVEQAAGILPQLKWINDLILGNRKVGGILCQLSMTPQGAVEYALIGIGINCAHSLPKELASIATSLARETGKDIPPAALAASLLQALYNMDRALLTEKESLMDAYRKNCITCGKEVILQQGEHQTRARALTVGENGGLLVEFPDGSQKMIASGEASIRGLSGYLS